MMESIWSDTAALPGFAPLKQHIKTAVLIIGGGITGILCTHFLTQAGVDCVLTEAERIGGGVTKNTTAKITAQHGLIYDKLLREFGTERARMYLEANQAALKCYQTLCRDIDCDFVQKDSFVYAKDAPEKLEKELKALYKLGYHAEYASNLPLPIPTAGAVKFKDQAQFHPLKFLSAIAQGLPIFEKTPITKLVGQTAIAGNHKIKAEKIIVATHFPLLNKHGSYFLKMYQHRSYVIALKNGPDVNGMYVDEAQKGLSFRNYENFLLLGGGDHRTGKKGGKWAELDAFAVRHYPDAKKQWQWAAQDCMTLDGVPYIGNYSKNTPNLFVATGFNKWGMTSSMAAARLLTDLVTGQNNPYAAVFSPSRTILRPQLALNGVQAAAGLLTPAAKRCPHMGCALKWNPDEGSWDCPCHGSRFTRAGKLIDNPANGNLKSAPKPQNHADKEQKRYH